MAPPGRPATDLLDLLVQLTTSAVARAESEEDRALARKAALGLVQEDRTLTPAERAVLNRVIDDEFRAACLRPEEGDDGRPA